MIEGETLPKLLLKKAEEHGDKPALRKKKYGIWHTLTWKEVFNLVKLTTYGLASLGIKKNDVIVMLSDNEPELLYTTLAAQSIGALPLTLYPDFLEKQIKALLNFSKAKVVIAGDQEQVDKILRIRGEVPTLKSIVYIDPKGLRNYKYNFLLSFKELINRGKLYHDENNPDFKSLLDNNNCEDIASLCLTSGTTGELPKIAMLSHKNLIFTASVWLKEDPYMGLGNYVSILPYAWIGEQATVAIWLVGDLIYNFPEEPETSWIDLREIAPVRVAGPPRMWEMLASQVQFKALDSTWLKRKFYEWGLKIGYKVADMEIKGEEIPWYYKLLHSMLYWIVYRPILDKIGLKGVKTAYTGGGALGPDYFLFFRALGVNLKEIYATTESSCAGCIHRDDDIKIGTTGKPLPGIEVKISDRGEILMRGDNVFMGYYNNPEATAKTIRDGWLHTGDTGLIDENGHLVVIDRMADLSVTSEGVKFSPQYIENMLKFSPFVKEAVVYGADKPYLVAMLCIDYDNVSKWAENRGIPFTDYQDLSQKDEIYALLESVVVNVNRRLPKALKIRRFTSLPKELDADDLELTRTRKLRRKFVYEKYADIIDALYSDLMDLETNISITYEDGRRGTLHTRIELRDAPEVD